MSSRSLIRTPKRLRTNNTARPLPLQRLLETLTPDQLRTVLTTLCSRHPSIAAELTSTAPRPSVSSALSVLHSYQAVLRESFPYGDRPTSDYSFNRVKGSLLALLDALRDYVPQFLPPQETQTAISLAFLDGITEIVAALPNWDSFLHNRYKDDAYDEIGAAWALVIREASKRGAGIQLQVGGWDRKIVRHDEVSGGKMGQAVQAIRECVGWGDGGTQGTGQGQVEDEREKVRRELFGGTYGGNAVQVGQGW
jgi:protein Cut8